MGLGWGHTHLSLPLLRGGGTLRTYCNAEVWIEASLLWSSSSDRTRIHMVLVLYVPQGASCAPLDDGGCQLVSSTVQTISLPPQRQKPTSSPQSPICVCPAWYITPTQSLASQNCPKHTYLTFSCSNPFETCPFPSLPKLNCQNLFTLCLTVTIQEQCKNTFQPVRHFLVRLYTLHSLSKTLSLLEVCLLVSGQDKDYQLPPPWPMLCVHLPWSLTQFCLRYGIN